METGRVKYEKILASPRPSPKISLKHDRMKELGSEVVRQPEGEVVQQSKSSQSSKPNPNPVQDRTEKHVVCPQRRASRSQDIETRSFREEAAKHDRTEKPVVCNDENHEHSMLNEDDIDFRIPGLPHSVVKQADNYRVRELVKQIENHPHRQALQHDLQQNNAYNPFSDKSKKMIMDMGFVELFELFETDPKTQCKECLLYWSESIVYCTCEHLLKESATNRGVIQKNWTFYQFQTTRLRKDDLMATDMGKLHKRKNIIKSIIWNRCGKTPKKKEYHQAHNLKKRCIKKRFSEDPRSLFDRFRISCIPARTWSRWRSLYQNEWSCGQRFLPSHDGECFRYKQNWWISLNKSGSTGPLRNRFDFNEALSTSNRPRQDSGERQLKPMPFWKYRQWHQSSSSSSSWLQWSDSWWNSW